MTIALCVSAFLALIPRLWNRLRYFYLTWVYSCMYEIEKSYTHIMQDSISYEIPSPSGDHAKRMKMKTLDVSAHDG